MIKHKISKPEAYGFAQVYGNKYWVYVPMGSAEADIEKLLRYLLKTCSKEKVMFLGAGYRPTEITFFVYTDPEKEEGVDAADLIYEWEKKEGLVKAK